MTHRGQSFRLLPMAASAALVGLLTFQLAGAQGTDRSGEFNDAHFHLTNYVQQGIEVPRFLEIMGHRVPRSTLFGIPLQQQWSYANSGDFAPTYYLQTDAPLYYYSFTDAYIASLYRALPTEAQARFDPMITGFNPADMYAADHIRRVLTTFPGVFTGIGEFSIHKEFVSSKIAGGPASLTDPALDRIFAFAAETGLVVILHNDIDMPFGRVDTEPGVRPVQVTAEAAERHPTHLQILERLLQDPALGHVAFDISWDEVAKYAVGSAEVIGRVTALFNRYPDRFLFGTDTVAPASPEAYYAVFDLWRPVWQGLTPDASLRIRRGNYERIFDEGRRRVRAWEQANVR